MRKIIFALLLLGCFLAVANTQSKLHHVDAQIAQLKKLIVKEQSTRDLYQQQLQLAETKASTISQKLAALQQQIQQTKQQLKRIQKNIAVTQTQLDNDKNQLALLLRQAYQIGDQPILKVLLDQTSLEKSQRMLMYYHYLSETQLNLIQAIQTALTKLQQDQLALQKTTATLTQSEAQQQQQQTALTATESQRAAVINQLNQRLHSRQAKLATLLANKHLLQQTVEKLTSQPQYQGRFSSLKGHLSWPVKGHTVDLFNTPVEHSQIKWDGILIRAKQDQPVHAIADGQVIFSKWMPGYGLLLIISHGNGYMTLYGRNHYLYVKAGDNVKAGDLIARVGKSGGYDNSALYFAIRHDAKPLDPVKWCL